MKKEYQEIIDGIENLNSKNISGTGYHQFKCKVCDDHTVRAGFKIEDSQIIYNCFRGRCGYKAVQNLDEPLTKKFKNVLEAFDVDIPKDLLLQKRRIQSIDKKLFTKHKYKDQDFPKNFVRYKPEKHTDIKEYLEDRCVETDDFLVVKKKGKKDSWDLVIPCFIGDTLIGWQIHDIYTGRYIKSNVSHLMYIHSGRIKPNIIVVEGVFDAMMFPNAVAIMANRLTPQQAYVLRNYSPILLPDRKDSEFIEDAILYGWRICIPLGKENDKPFNAKDSNEYVKENGKFALAKIVGENIYTDYKIASAKYEQWRIKDRNR